MSDALSWLEFKQQLHNYVIANVELIWLLIAYCSSNCDGVYFNIQFSVIYIFSICQETTNAL